MVTNNWRDVFKIAAVVLVLRQDSKASLICLLKYDGVNGKDALAIAVTFMNPHMYYGIYDCGRAHIHTRLAHRWLFLCITHSPMPVN